MNKKIILKINYPNNMQYPVNGFILGIEGFCVGFNKTFNIREVEKIKDEYKDKEIFVSLNRVIFNNELDEYKMILQKLDNIGLNGIIVGDVAALTYDLKTNIILDQMHLNNSYLSINHYYKNNKCSCYLTDDITKDEINEIKKHTKAKLFKLVFGYSMLSISKRKLLSNYKKYFNIEDYNDHYLICEDKSNDYYNIVEDDFGSFIYSSKPINLLSKINDLNIYYAVIDDYLIYKNIDLVINAFMNNDISLNKKINDEFNASLGFIEKETIYKVKYDE